MAVVCVANKRNSHSKTYSSSINNFLCFKHALKDGSPCFLHFCVFATIFLAYFPSSFGWSYRNRVTLIYTSHIHPMDGQRTQNSLDFSCNFSLFTSNSVFSFTFHFIRVAPSPSDTWEQPMSPWSPTSAEDDQIRDRPRVCGILRAIGTLMYCVKHF